MSNQSSAQTNPAAGGEGGQKEGKSRYRSTLNLPQTAFPMKASLVQNEPASLKRWAKIGLYETVRKERAGRPRFVFHDGPPYANGSIHLGHMMNKCLKDFVVRSKTMQGMDCPFVPGWDCHGLPIEHKVMTELVEAGKLEKLLGLEESTRRMAVRRECQKYAEKFHKLHTQQMTRLLTLADYDNPYLTMQPAFEGATMEVLAALLEQGLVYRAVKPVHWSIANETALAEAELEYYDREDLSVYVDFEALDAEAVYDAFGLPPHSDDDDDEDDAEDAAHAADGPAKRPHQKPSFMIWTTTPWTLPANVAVAVHPDTEYSLVRVDGNITVMANALVEKVAKLAGAEDVTVLGTAPGSKLQGLRYKHPFVTEQPACALGQDIPEGRCWSVVTADYVTLEDGTGLVHTAPGHGAEDYQTGLKHTLPVYCPVMGNGAYDSTVPEWLRGVDIWKANEAIAKRLRESGHMFHDHRFTHSYPHDWRSKTPVIFRCTEQWFIGVDRATARDGKSLRDLALGAVEPTGADARIKFVPEWGRNRMRGMLESRPDWCISRQRSWGLPIPAFFFKKTGGAQDGAVGCLMTPASVRAVAKVVRAKGSDAWFTMQPAELLGEYDPAADKDAPKGLTRADLASLTKGPDILDVWFESGSSWNSVMRERSGGADFPVDLYLEGSDQHRGWFQTSLLPSLGMMGKPPFKTVLTHGFMVGKDGAKLSKSKGDTIEALFNDYGSDVLRWWTSSLAYENDVKVDREFFDVAGEGYRKVRNTLRFMLSNLGDFDPAAYTGKLADLPPTSIDAWILGAFNTLAKNVIDAYNAFDFRGAHQELYNFCNDTLSAVYLAAVKDRLYCDKADSPRRRRTQATLWHLTDGLCRLLAPVLCHTADEAWRALLKAGNDDPRCVHTQEFIASFPVTAAPEWAKVMAARDKALLAIERAKKETGLENPLDAGVTMPDPDGVLAKFDAADLADLLGVSRAAVGGDAASVQDLRDQPRCERSWKRDGTVKERSDGGLLTDRDAEALGLA